MYKLIKVMYYYILIISDTFPWKALKICTSDSQAPDIPNLSVFSGTIVRLLTARHVHSASDTFTQHVGDFAIAAKAAGKRFHVQN